MGVFFAGIIDPLKVVKTALVDAASVAGQMITTEAAITDLPPEPGAGPAWDGILRRDNIYERMP